MTPSQFAENAIAAKYDKLTAAYREKGKNLEDGADHITEPAMKEALQEQSRLCFELAARCTELAQLWGFLTPIIKTALPEFK